MSRRRTARLDRGLFADPGIETLVIATPTRTPADLVEAAARQGRGHLSLIPRSAPPLRAVVKRTPKLSDPHVSMGPQWWLSRLRGALLAADCVGYDQDLFRDAYVAELADFTDCVRTAGTPSVTGEDARAALSMALAAIRSITTGGPVRIDELQDR